MQSASPSYCGSGDTGYFHGFAEIGRRFRPIDVVLLPIGASAPRWFMAYQHMNPKEAYQAFHDLVTRFMIPIYWRTFDLPDEPLGQPIKDLAVAIRSGRGDPDLVRILAIGEGWHLPEKSGISASHSIDCEQITETVALTSERNVPEFSAFSPVRMMI